MAIIVKSINDIGAGDRILPADGDIIIIEEGITVAATGLSGDGIAGALETDLMVFVDGVLAGEDNAVEVGANSNITVSHNGALIGTNNAAYLNGNGIVLSNQGSILSAGAQAGAVYLTASATDNIIDNSGSISSDAVGIFINGLRATLTNTGSINGVTVGIQSNFAADIDNAGTITSSEGSALNFSGAAGAVDLVNSGTINSELEAFRTAGGGNSITNSGTITSDVRDGIFITGDGAGTTITNTATGTIQAEDIGVYVAGTATQLVNDGTIASRSEQGVYLSGADNSTFVNNGSVSAEFEGVYISGSNFTITNNGSITSLDQDAVQMNVDTNGGTAQLINNGIIATQDPGNIAAVTGDGSSTDFDVVRNNATGQIIGDVDLNGGDDTLMNRGLIDGDVQLEGGADTFDGRNGTVTGTVDLGGDNDTAYVNEPTLVIDGGSGTDTLNSWDDVLNASGFEEITLRGEANATAFGDDNTVDMNGNAGDNAMYGSTIANNIKGFGGDDELYGFAGSDTLRGNTGDDFLDGGSEDDVLFGGTGNDTILGGTGADVMRGEQGVDTFVWADINEAGVGAARDVVIGFDTATETLDLSAIGDASFAFLGTGAFTGGGGMEVRYRVQAAGHSIVELDSNGDGIVDAEIQVRGVTSLSADDFVL